MYVHCYKDHITGTPAFSASDYFCSAVCTVYPFFSQAHVSSVLRCSCLLPPKVLLAETHIDEMTARTRIVLDQLVDVALDANSATEREEGKQHMDQFIAQVRLSDVG